MCNRRRPTLCWPGPSLCGSAHSLWYGPLCAEQAHSGPAIPICKKVEKFSWKNYFFENFCTVMCFIQFWTFFEKKIFLKKIFFRKFSNNFFHGPRIKLSSKNEMFVYILRICCKNLGVQIHLGGEIQAIYEIWGGRARACPKKGVAEVGQGGRPVFWILHIDIYHPQPDLAW